MTAIDVREIINDDMAYVYVKIYREITSPEGYPDLNLEYSCQGDLNSILSTFSDRDWSLGTTAEGNILLTSVI